MKTSIMQMRGANWSKVRRDVNKRINLLEAIVQRLEPTPINDAIANDMILPALELLGDFCACVVIENEPESERGPAQ
jgi:hypothetical protein